MCPSTFTIKNGNLPRIPQTFWLTTVGNLCEKTPFMRRPTTFSSTSLEVRTESVFCNQSAELVNASAFSASGHVWVSREQYTFLSRKTYIPEFSDVR